MQGPLTLSHVGTHIKLLSEQNEAQQKGSEGFARVKELPDVVPPAVSTTATVGSTSHLRSVFQPQPLLIFVPFSAGRTQPGGAWTLACYQTCWTRRRPASSLESGEDRRSSTHYF